MERVFIITKEERKTSNVDFEVFDNFDDAIKSFTEVDMDKFYQRKLYQIHKDCLEGFGQERLSAYRIHEKEIWKRAYELEK